MAILYSAKRYTGVEESGAVTGSGAGASVTIADTAPSSPTAGDLWFNSTSLKTFVYYNDGSSSQWLPSNPVGLRGPTGNTGSAANVVTQYSNVSSFSSSNNTIGDFAFAQDTKALYMWDGTEWDRVSLGIDESPVITTEPESIHILNSDGSTSTVTMVATDPEGFGITYGIAYPTTNNALPDQLATATSINQSTGVYTFDPSTTESDAGTVKVRLSASDGISTTTRFCTLSLAFSVDITTPNSAPFTQAGINTASAYWSSATSTTGMGFSSELSTGKKYFEVVNSNNSNYGIVGLVDNTVTSFGYNTTGFIGLNPNGNKYTGNDNIGLSTWYTSGGVLMIAYDTSTREIWLGTNGTWYEDPSTTSSSFTVGTSSTTSFKMAFGSIIGGGATYTNTYDIITGSQTFNYTVPSGFTGH